MPDILPFRAVPMAPVPICAEIALKLDAKREMVKSNFAICKSECEILKSNHEIRIFAISWVYAVIDRMMVTVSTSQRTTPDGLGRVARWASVVAHSRRSDALAPTLSAPSS